MPVTDTGREFTRFIVNGLVAAGLQYSVLYTLYELVGVPSAGLSNFVAALFGITASFLGNRYFVFRKGDQPIRRQVVSFLILYGTIALIHGSVLLVWTDIYALNYNVGFLLATALQIGFSFVGNKWLVFR